MPDLEKKIEHILQSITDDPVPVGNWLYLGGIMLAHQAWDSLYRLFSDRNDLYGDGLKLYSDLILSHEVALSEHIQNIILGKEISNLSNGPEAFLEYMKGAILISSGEIETGRLIFKSISHQVEINPLLGEGLPHLFGLDKFYKQFFTPTEIKEALNHEGDEINNGINFYGNNSSQLNPTFYAACDLVYFNKFAEKFISVFSKFGSVHIHVVGGDRDVLEDYVKQHQNLNLSLSSEVDDTELGSPYYACARFMRGNRIMEFLKSDLVILDIDVEDAHGFEAFLEASEQNDVTMFENITNVPWLKYPAAAIYIKNNKIGREYLSCMEVVLTKALESSAWFIDQSILLSVNNYFKDKMEISPITYLEEKEGFILNDLIIPTDNLEEKRSIRSNTGFVR